MLKWDTSDPGVQRTVCGRFAVVRATSNPEWWIPYDLRGGAAWKDLGERHSMQEAKQTCENAARPIA